MSTQINSYTTHNIWLHLQPTIRYILQRKTKLSSQCKRSDRQSERLGPQQDHYYYYRHMSDVTDLQVKSKQTNKTERQKEKEMKCINPIRDKVWARPVFPWPLQSNMVVKELSHSNFNQLFSHPHLQKKTTWWSCLNSASLPHTSLRPDRPDRPDLTGLVDEE